MKKDGRVVRQEFSGGIKLRELFISLERAPWMDKRSTVANYVDRDYSGVSGRAIPLFLLTLGCWLELSLPFHICKVRME